MMCNRTGVVPKSGGCEIREYQRFHQRRAQPQLRSGVGFVEKQSRVCGSLEMSGRKSHEPFQKMLHVVNAKNTAIDAHAIWAYSTIIINITNFIIIIITIFTVIIVIIIIFIVQALRIIDNNIVFSFCTMKLIYTMICLFSRRLRKRLFAFVI